MPRAVLYEGPDFRRKTVRAFDSARDREDFFTEQQRVMAHAGFTVARERNREGDTTSLTITPPPDSLSDGTQSVWYSVP